MKASATFILCTVFNISLSAQSDDLALSRVIHSKDSLFWTLYNTCNTEPMNQLLTDGVEFYHDKGGVTLGRENLVTSLQKNLCSNADFRIRRQAVEGTVKVFPLKNNGVVYGAIISGDHVFYILEKGKPERLDGLAKFVNVWMLENNAWRMSRILSYDHGPAPYTNKRKEITLSEKALDQFNGQYKSPQFGMGSVRRVNGVLNLLINNETFVLYPFADNTFFVKDRDLTFEFTRAEKGISKMIVRENGNVVEEAVRDGN